MRQEQATGSAVEVLGLVARADHAVSYVRFFQPFERLGRFGYRLRLPPAQLRLTRGAAGHEPDPGLLDGVSILVFPQMILSPALGDGSRVDVVEPLCRLARERGIKVVYSPDDHLEDIEPANPSYEIVSDSARNLRSLLTGSDALIVTTEELRRTLAAWDKPTWVLPNAVDPARWSMRPRCSGELRVGWAGSSSHVEDLLLVLPAVRAVQRRIPFRFFILGLVDRPLAEMEHEVQGLRRSLPPSKRLRAERFLELTRQLRDVDHEHEPFGPLQSYFSRLPALDLDVGLCPLVDTPFNRHKSALKFYEYAITGSMTLASAIPPYAAEVSVTVANDPRAWAETLERFLRDDAARLAHAEAQRSFVLLERNIDTLCEAWARALGGVLAGDSAARRADRDRGVLVPCSVVGAGGTEPQDVGERDE